MDTWLKAWLIMVTDLGTYVIGNKPIRFNLGISLEQKYNLH